MTDLSLDQAEITGKGIKETPSSRIGPKDISDFGFIPVNYRYPRLGPTATKGDYVGSGRNSSRILDPWTHVL